MEEIKINDLLNLLILFPVMIYLLFWVSFLTLSTVPTFEQIKWKEDLDQVFLKNFLTVELVYTPETLR